MLLIYFVAGGVTFSRRGERGAPPGGSVELRASRSASRAGAGKLGQASRANASRPR